MSRGLPTPMLMFVTPSMDRVEEAVRGGVNVVQLRDESSSAPRFAGSAESERAAILLVNSDVDAAVACQADGVHLKERGVPARDVRLRAGDMLIGRSVHSVESALRAVEDGADYLIAGTVYESKSHPGVEASGIALLGAICESVDVPVIAIGGVTPERVAECVAAGAAGVAVRSPLLETHDVAGLAAEYRHALDAAFAAAKEGSEEKG